MLEFECKNIKILFMINCFVELSEMEVLKVNIVRHLALECMGLKVLYKFGLSNLKNIKRTPCVFLLRREL